MTPEEAATVALILLAFRFWLATRDPRFLVAADAGRAVLGVQLRLHQ